MVWTWLSVVISIKDEYKSLYWIDDNEDKGWEIFPVANDLDQYNIDSSDYP